MSTIAARAHSGSTLSAPARRAASSRRKTSWLSQLARSVVRRPGRALMILTFGGIACAILLNAVLFQNARHPAPIASAPESSQTPRSVERRAETPAVTPAAPVSPAAPAAVPASAPVPPARPTDLSQPVRETQIRPPAAVTNVPRSAAAPAAPAPAPAPAARAAAPRDPIADLINGGDLRPPAEIRGARSASARREN
jgi:hypothetical protein